MSFEIALLQWSEEPGAEGVRLVGRTRDGDLISAVRKLLLARLQDPLSDDPLPEDIQQALPRREH